MLVRQVSLTRLVRPSSRCLSCKDVARGPQPNPFDTGALARAHDDRKSVHRSR
jgi:hypothetical protein